MGILETIRCAEDIRALPLEQLTALCGELRATVLDVVSQRGGHLASNLGVVELTVALYNIYDPMRDRLVFDVGHQCYVHKLLSGRLEQFATLRTEGGLSGFPKPSESQADAFIAGHASSAVSTALGMARARTLQGGDYDVVALVGDGALTGGLAYEGLNSLGQSREPLVIILNDNGIAISHTVGGMARYLTRLRVRPAYYALKKQYRRFMLHTCVGKKLFQVSQRMKNRLKSAILASSMFEEMGIRYLGPVDGHNIKQLSYMLKVARDYREPVLLHVVTKKGKGYVPAEDNPDIYHGVGPFDKASGVALRPHQDFSTVFGETLCRLAAEDPRICAITAAMEEGTGLSAFHRVYPDRFFDEGIAEGHCVTMAAGMAKQGLKPVFAVYSTFLQRGYDMLLQDVGLQQLPVVLAVDRAGLVGADGETHHGVFDICYLSQVPGMTIWAPASLQELRDMLPAALACGGPAALRYARGCEGGYREGGALPLRELRQGGELTILSYGILINEALAAASLLKEKGISAQVLKLGVVFPLDLAALRELLPAGKPLLVLEDCADLGSVGQRLAAELRDRPVLRLNLGDGIVRQGTVAQQRRRCGIDAEAVAARAEALG